MSIHAHGYALAQKNNIACPHRENDIIRESDNTRLQEIKDVLCFFGSGEMLLSPIIHSYSSPMVRMTPSLMQRVRQHAGTSCYPLD
jgi:hypothetical protein